MCILRFREILLFKNTKENKKLVYTEKIKRQVKSTYLLLTRIIIIKIITKNKKQNNILFIKLKFCKNNHVQKKSYKLSKFIKISVR